MNEWKLRFIAETNFFLLETEMKNESQAEEKFPRRFAYNSLAATHSIIWYVMYVRRSKRGVMQNVRWTWKLKDFSHTLLKYSMEKKNFLLREFFFHQTFVTSFLFLFCKPNNGGDGGIHKRMIYLMFDSFAISHSSLLSLLFHFLYVSDMSPWSLNIPERLTRGVR